MYPEFSTTPDEPKKAALTWGIYNKFNNVLAPKPEVFAFLTEVFSELCDLFPGPYIHVGGAMSVPKSGGKSRNRRRSLCRRTD